jgi:cell wall-associated NlpC family hydrolase
VYGAAGPGSYDCSGLTMAAWDAAGVSLPHNAAAQYAATSPVSMSALRPGDLVYHGRPAYHVGIYVGDGKVIDAPHTGAVVHVVGLDVFDYASRP